MTQIVCNISKSGSNQPLTGYISVNSTSQLTNSTTFYTTSPVQYQLTNGSVTFDLEPSDRAKVAYFFQLVESNTDGTSQVLDSFEAVIPYSAVPINFVTLPTQSGLRYDRRDASILTLARYLISNDSFTGFLGQKLWNNRGAWAGTPVYKKGDVVTYNGSSYQYVSSLQQSGIQPGTDSTWVLIASKGDIGTNGLLGALTLYPSTAPVPSKYLRCSGQTVATASYPDLANAYGVAAGATQFVIPDSPIAGDLSFIVLVLK